MVSKKDHLGDNATSGPITIRGVVWCINNFVFLCGRAIALAVLPKYFTLSFGLIWWLPTAQHDAYFEPPDYLCCLMNCFSVRSFLKEEMLKF